MEPFTETEGVRSSQIRSWAWSGPRRMAKGFLRKVVKKIVSIAYEKLDLEIAVLSLDRARIEEIEDHPHYSCRRLKTEDLGRIEERFGKTVSGEFSRRMDHSIGYLMFDKDALVGYVWGTNNSIDSQGVRSFLFQVEPEKESIYFYDMYIVPERRGSGLYKRLKHYHLFEAKKAGFKKAFLVFDRRNATVRSKTSRLGFQIEGRLSFSRLFWRPKKEISTASGAGSFE
jgi:GNAT superfamily N-acetyltransferase